MCRTSFALHMTATSCSHQCSRSTTPTTLNMPTLVDCSSSPGSLSNTHAIGSVQLSRVLRACNVKTFTICPNLYQDHALGVDYSFKNLNQSLRLSSLPASQCPCLLYLKLIPSATEHHCSSSHGLHHRWYFPVLPGTPFPTTAATVPLQLPSQCHFVTIMLPEVAES